MIPLTPMTAGYIAIAILVLISATFMGSIKLLQVRSDNSPDVELQQSTPTVPEGLCATTIWISNKGTKTIFIRNITIGCGTFSGSEIRNILGQITGYQHGTDLYRACNLSIEPGTRADDFIVFHAQAGIPVIATLAGSNGIYDIHLSQPATTH